MILIGFVRRNDPQLEIKFKESISYTLLETSEFFLLYVRNRLMLNIVFNKMWQCHFIKNLRNRFKNSIFICYL